MYEGACCPDGSLDLEWYGLLNDGPARNRVIHKHLDECTGWDTDCIAC